MGRRVRLWRAWRTLRSVGRRKGGRLPGVVGENVGGVRVVAKFPGVGWCHRGKDDFGSLSEEHSRRIFEVCGESLHDFRYITSCPHQTLFLKRIITCIEWNDMHLLVDGSTRLILYAQSSAQRLSIPGEGNKPAPGQSALPLSPTTALTGGVPPSLCPNSITTQSPSFSS
jgi:hypothetical protein